jgi:hypothetical protein
MRPTATSKRLMLSAAVWRRPVVVVVRDQNSMCVLVYSVTSSVLHGRMVSQAGRGCGRAAGDRQFFYLNGRPVDVPRATRLLNESYRSAALGHNSTWKRLPSEHACRLCWHVPQLLLCSRPRECTAPPNSNSALGLCLFPIT